MNHQDLVAFLVILIVGLLVIWVAIALTAATQPVPYPEDWPSRPAGAAHFPAPVMR